MGLKRLLNGSLLALALLLVGLGAAALARPARPPGSADPCRGPGSGHLLCPNLRIAPPSELYAEGAAGGRVLLHATSNVESRGRGPMELRGRRTGTTTMSVRQRIYRTGGGRLEIPTGIHLHFTDVGSAWGGHYWKVHQLATFELWSVNAEHRLKHLVRIGPKTNYCLRDLERTRPGPDSPRAAHYPGCNQNPGRRTVTLGTSVGWSDIYPSDYDKQWINVAGLHGCFAFVMKVDPHNLLRETHEHDNESRRLVHLPFHADTGC